MTDFSPQTDTIDGGQEEEEETKLKRKSNEKRANTQQENTQQTSSGPSVTCKFLSVRSFQATLLPLNELPHDKTNKVACAHSEDSDQPGHPLSA